MGIARVFLDLVHDAQRRAGVGFLGRHRQAQALAGHALLHPVRLGALAGIVAERSVEERLGLRRHAVPVDRGADQDAVGRQEVLQEQFGVPVGRRRRTPQVRQEGLDVVVQEQQRGLDARRLGPAQRGRAQRRAVAVAPRAADQNQQALGGMI